MIATLLVSLSLAASQYAGMPVQVSCVPDDALAGYTYRADGMEYIQMRGKYCGALSGILGGTPRGLDYATHLYANGGVSSWAVLAFTHEATHALLQSNDEGRVECYAVHHTRLMMSLLGVPVWAARILQRDAMQQHLYNFAPGSPYRTVC